MASPSLSSASSAASSKAGSLRGWGWSYVAGAASAVALAALALFISHTHRSASSASPVSPSSPRRKGRNQTSKSHRQLHRSPSTSLQTHPSAQKATVPTLLEINPMTLSAASTATEVKRLEEAVSEVRGALPATSAQGQEGATTQSVVDEDKEGFFLGLDCSTQSMSVIVVNRSGENVFRHSLRFDEELAHFGTVGGVHHHQPDPPSLQKSPRHSEVAESNRVTAPSLMFVEALDHLLLHMQQQGFDFSRVRAVSGSAQQHGSIYWAKGASDALANLSSDKTLREQLSSAFCIPDAPVWMDSSTKAYCDALEKAVGGAQAVADLSGSRAYERYTGNQIAKLAETEAFHACERISLISSALASMFIGKYAPIDVSDGSGMNLMGIFTCKWSLALMAATNVKNLQHLLGPHPVPSHQCVGLIHPYFVQRFGFQSSCQVIAFSGDNPCTLAGLGMSEEGDVAVTLGTSTCVMSITSSPCPSGSEGHVLVNPVDPKTFITMLCFKNGALAREDVRDRCAAGSWRKFNALLRSTEPGNAGRIGFFYDEIEITPRLQHTGVFGFNEHGRLADFSDDVAAEVRAIVESQCLAMKKHSLGLGTAAPRRVIAGGGAAANSAILEILGHVFDAPVLVALDGTDAAARGAALRAVHGAACEKAKRFVPFSEVALPRLRKVHERPSPAQARVYSDLLDRFTDLQEQVIQALN